MALTGISLLIRIKIIVCEVVVLNRNINCIQFSLKYIIHLMCAPEGNSEFCFPESLRMAITFLFYTAKNQKLL